MARLPKNFTRRSDSGAVQVCFRWQGRRYRRDYPADLPTGEAIRRGKAFMDRVKSGRVRDDGPLPGTLAEAFDRWLEGPVTNRCRRAQQTAHGRLLRPRRLLGSLRIEDVTVEHLYALRAALLAELSPWSVVGTLQDVRAALVYVGHPPEWPKRMLPRPRCVPRPLSAAELEAVTAAAPERVRWIVRLLALTGLRWGEFVRLEWRHVRELPKPHLLVKRSKNGTSRVVPLFPEAREILRERFGSGAVGFVSPYRSRNGNVLTRGVDWPVEWSPHRLRHTCATRLREMGWSLSEVQAFLGHRSIQSTLVYAGFGEEAVFAAVDRAPLSIRPQWTAPEEEIPAEESAQG